MRARAGLLLVVACGAPRGPHLYPAGSDKDDGYGDLAQNSAQLLTSDGPDATDVALHNTRRPRDADAPPDLTDSDADDWPPPVPAYTHDLLEDLTGVLAGTVTWRGAAPAPLTTACGQVPPPLRIAADHGVGGVLVTIDRIETGRTPAILEQPLVIGGLVVKRGCALFPAIQIVTPLPADLAVHGDAAPAQLRVSAPTGTRTVELAAGGRARFPAGQGVTRLEADDGSLGAAWVVAEATPAYAITDDHGRYRLGELAPGSYEVAFWRPALPTVRDGRLVYGAPAVTRRTIHIADARTTRLDLAVGR